MSMEKYSAPCLADDMANDPELALKFYRLIPDIESIPNDRKLWMGDLAKFNGEVKVYDGKSWVAINRG